MNLYAGAKRDRRVGAVKELEMSMVAIASGNSLGLSLTSLEVLGQLGPRHNPVSGRSGEGIYVNIANGNLVLQSVDDTLVARGDDISLLRSYNSQGLITDDNADNWSHGVYAQQMQLTGTVLTAGSTLTRTGRDGAKAVYSFDQPTQSYVSNAGPGAHDRITYNATTSQYIWTEGSSLTKEYYQSTGQGRLVRTEDRASNAIEYFYNANGTLSYLSTSAGESTYFDYSGTNLTQIRTVALEGTRTRTRYTYDASNRLTSVTVDLSPQDNSVTDGKKYVTTYTYSGTSKRVASIVQTDGTGLSFTYVQVGSEYRVATVTDHQGRITSYSYDTVNRRTTVVDPLGLSTVYAYDTSGRLTQVTAPSVGGTSQVFSYAYDGSSNVTGVTDAEGRLTTYQYNSQGLVTLERDAAGNSVRRTFGSNNQLIAEAQYVVADPDGAGSALPSVPLVTRYAYSGSQNLLRFVVSPDGRVTEHKYDTYGQRTATIQYNGARLDVSGYSDTQAPSETTLAAWVLASDRSLTSRADMTYDVRGQLQSVTRYAKVSTLGVGISDGTQSITQYVYSSSGQLLQTVDPRAGSTVFTYDGMGRQLSSQDASGQTTLSSYDDVNRRTTVTQANGLMVTSSYDSAGRLLSALRTDSASANLGTTENFYDANGRLRMTQDPTGVKAWALYDEAGRKTADIDGDGSVIEYYYNKNNQITRSISYATGINTAQLVDSNGLPTNVALSSIRPASSAADQSRWFAYDSANRLVKTVNALGAVTATVYDGASRVVSTTTYATLLATSSLGNAPAVSAISPSTSANDRTQRSFYNSDGQLLATLDAAGYLTELRYDNLGRAIRSTSYATPTPVLQRVAGTLAQLRPSAHPSDATSYFLFDNKGQLAGQIDAEGYLTESVYDANGNITQSIRYAAKVAPAAIAALTDSSSVASVRPASQATDRIVTRTYDALNRTTQEVNAEGTVAQFSYDNVGRLTGRTTAVSTADVRGVLSRFDLLGRLTGELSAVGAALLSGGQTQAQIDAIWAQHGTSYTYDAAGRRTSSTDPLGNRALYFYDADSRLTHSVNALGEVTQTQYNALGQISAEIRYGTRIDTSSLIGEFAGGILQTELAEALDAIRNPALDSKLLYTYNQAGARESLTDAAGNTTAITYNAFGEEVSRSQTIDSGRQRVESRAYDRRGLLTSEALDPTGINAVTSAIYDAFGRATSRTDALGNTRQQSYDRLGRVVSETGPAGESRSSTYDAFDRVLTRTDALGKVTTYSYSDSARSVTITTPEGISVTTVRNRHGQTQSVTDGRGNTTTYAYDKSGNLLSTNTALNATSNQYDSANRLSRTVDANGNEVVLTYDVASRLLTRTVDPAGLNLVTTYGYDAKGQQIRITDPNGVVTALAYDLKGQLLSQTIDPNGLNLVTSYTYDGLGNTLLVNKPNAQLLYAYDKLGRRTQERVDPYGLNITRSYVFDGKGNVTQATDPNGAITRFAYDKNDRLVYSVDPLGNVRFTKHDAEGRLTQTVAFATPIATTTLGSAPTVAQIQALVVSTPAQDMVEHRVLDDDGRLLASVNALGEVTKYTYDASGNVSERIRFATRINMQTWVVGAEPLPAADTARDQVTRTVYDQLNRALFTVDGVGAVVAFSYDGNGNVTERVSYAAVIPTATAATQTAIAAAVALVAQPTRDNRVRMVYDAANRLTWQVNGIGAVIQNKYDKNGNLAKTIQYASAIEASANPSSLASGPLNAADRITDFAYDKNNRLVYKLNSLGFLTQSTYDNSGNIVRRTEYHTRFNKLHDPSKIFTLAELEGTASSLRNITEDRVTNWFYDGANRVGVEIDAMGGAKQYNYDAAGRRIEEIHHANRLANVNSLPLLAQDHLIRSTISPNATEDRRQRFAYDASGQLTYSVDAEGYVTHSTFDGVGRKTSTTNYSLAIPGSVANNAGAIAAAVVAAPTTDQTTNFAYDAAGRLTSTTDSYGKLESNAYDALGNKVSFTNKLGAVWTYEFDQAGRTTRETSPQVELGAMARDANGNLVASSGLASVVTVYSHDALGNLQSRTEAFGRAEERTTRYTYDALGRQVSTIFQAVGFYNAAGDTLTTNGAAGSASRVENVYSTYSQVTYDAFGNAVANRNVDGAISYKAYDKLGRLTYDVDALGYVTQYQLNAWGQTTSTTRFSERTNLLANTPTSLSQEQIYAAVYANGVSHSSDRTLLTAYDRLGQKTSVTEPTAFTYNSSTGVGAYAAKVTAFNYNSFGNLVTESVLNDASAQTYTRTHTYFDRRGLETARVDALGYVTTQYHDGRGNLSARIEHASAIAGWNASAAPAQAPQPVASLDDRRTDFSYDRLNRKVMERRVGVEFTASAKSTVVNRGNLDTTYTYDDIGNTTSVTDASNETTYTYHDALGRVRAVVAPAQDIEGTFKRPLSTFLRDAHGNVLVKTDFANGASAANSSTFTAGVTSANDRTERALYDSLGRAVQVTDATSADRYTSYNNRGQVAKEWQAVTDADGATKTIFKAYKYDAVGNQTHIITPATTDVLAGGLNITGVVSANPVGTTFSGTNSVGLSWPDLVDANGGLVRVQVTYNTRSTLSQVVNEYGTPITDEYGAPIYTGVASQSASRTQDFSAATAQNGATLSWSDGSSAVGGISSVSYIRVWQQIGGGTWQMKWEGQRSATTGSQLQSITQAQAGVDETQMKFNAFGEMTRRGINGGDQEYFDYQTSGVMWRTNSEDGVDKVYLHDIQGRKTADIVSGGSANLLNFANAELTSYLGSADVRRTEYVYDALGRVAVQKGPERIEGQGGISVLRSYGNVSSGSTLFYPNVSEDGAYLGGYWYGTNTLTASWDTLQGLGSGDVKVTFDYNKRGYSTTIPRTIYDEYGNPSTVYTHGAVVGAATSSTKIVTADQAQSGISWSWTENSGWLYGATQGGIASVSRVRVWKKDLGGNWVSVLDRSTFGFGGNTIQVAAPSNPTTTIQLQMRPVGSSTWTTQPLTKFDDAYRFDASALAAGNWEYQVLTTNAGEATRVTSSGTMGLSGGVLSITSSFGAATRSVRPVINQTFDRWGNVTQTNDARSPDWKTTFRYNANNQVIEQKRPDEAGLQSATSPVTSVFYDKLGRQVTSVDAKGNTSGQVFDAQGNLTQEQSADGGTVAYSYNLFGDKVRKLDARNFATTYTYDKLSRLLQTAYATVQRYTVNGSNNVVDQGSGAVAESYTWDQAGRKLTQTNGAGETLKYYYDLQGNLLRTVFPLTQSAKSIYNARGFKTVEVDANGNTNIWKYDYFGQVQGHTDLANNRYTYTYNAARQLIAQTNTLGANKSYSYDRAGQLTQITDSALNQVTSYAYDLAGNRVRESTTRAGVVYQDNHLAYDTLGRLRWVADSRAMVEMWYDQAGNRTRIKTSVINGDTAYNADRYFRYDAMNRQTVVDAVDAAGNLGTTGRAISYDLNGNRTGESFHGTKVNVATNVATTGTVSEAYTYDAMNRLTGVARDGTTIDTRLYDQASRVVQSGGAQAVAYYNALYGTGVLGTGSELRINRYDANGRTAFMRVMTTAGAAKYNLSYNNYDAAGNLLGYSLQNFQGTAYTNTYSYGLLKRDAYKESTLSGTSSGAFVPATTTNGYDVNSNLVSIADSGNSGNNRSFINDDAGRVLQKTQGGAVERQLVANGEVLGRFGGALADFNFSYTPISASFPKANPGTYAVGASDNLRSIARAAYGDSSLWYLIAEANGVASDKELRVGQTLNVPNRVTGAANNASTFKPYDPAKVVGDTTPTLNSPPPPPQKKGCGGLGQLLMVVVAVVVAVNAPQLLPSLKAYPVLTAAASAALGSVASQAVGVATGTIDKFSWKGVALSALSGGITKGLPEFEAFKGFTETGRAVANAAVANAMTQGIAVITGLQDKFDWRGVAASAVGTRVGLAVGGALKDTSFGLGETGDTVARGALRGFAAGTAAAVARGGRVAVQQIAVDAFGNALGSSIAEMSNSSPLQQAGPLPGQLGSGSYGVGDVDNLLLEQFGRGSTVTSGTAQPLPEVTPADHRASERAYRELTSDSAAGAGYRAVQGDSISRILGTSNPQAVGNFMRANGLSSSNISAGRNYFVPTDTGAYGNSAALGQATLNADNAALDARLQAQEATSGNQLMSQGEAYAIRMSGGSRGGTGVAYGDAPIESKSGIDPSMGVTGSKYGDQLLGGALGVAEKAWVAIDGTVRILGNSVIQIGDIVTLGVNHDHPLIQQAWVEQGALANGVGRLITEPRAVARDALEAVADNYAHAQALRDQGDEFGAARINGGQTSAIAMGVFGGAQSLRGAGGLTSNVVGRGARYTVNALPESGFDKLMQVSALVDRAAYRLNPLNYNYAGVGGTFGFGLVPTGLKLSGVVEVRVPIWATASQKADYVHYTRVANEALDAGYLSPTGRVSTNGVLRSLATQAARAERTVAERSGRPYQGVVGHGPDTTWTGKADAFRWIDQNWRVNNSLGGQAGRYPIGYMPTEFVLRGHQ
jgi:YD repeat-containing protein